MTPLTWREFKAQAEAAGVTDDDTVMWIAFTNHPPVFVERYEADAHRVKIRG